MEIQTNEAPSKCIRGEPVEPRTDKAAVFPMHPGYRLRRNGQPAHTFLLVCQARTLPVRIRNAHGPHHLVVLVLNDVAVPGKKP